MALKRAVAGWGGGNENESSHPLSSTLRIAQIDQHPRTAYAIGTATPPTACASPIVLAPTAHVRVSSICTGSLAVPIIFGRSLHFFEHISRSRSKYAWMVLVLYPAGSSIAVAFIPSARRWTISTSLSLLRAHGRFDRLCLCAPSDKSRNAS